MRMQLDFFLASVLLLALPGCSTQRKAVGESSASLEYRQAVSALSEGNFTIELGDVFFPSDRTPVNTLDSYISVRDGRGSIHFSQELFASFVNLNIMNVENGQARISLEKSKKNGDRFYVLYIVADMIKGRRNVLITLYNDTNDCFVRFYGGVTESLFLSARGKVYPEARQGLGTSRR